MPHYLYGVVPSGAAAPAEQGLGGAAVAVRPATDDLGVLASEVDTEAVQPRRRHLEAHDRVLRAAMLQGPVLPFRFGAVTAGSPGVVLDGVDTRRARERLAELDGRVEVQVLWEPHEDLAVARVAERRPELRDRRLAAIDRGRSVAEGVADLAVEDLTSIRTSLSDHAVMFGAVEPRGMSARLPALVEHGHLDAFLEACAVAAERAGDVGSLRTVGALPPYSFVQLDREPIGA